MKSILACTSTCLMLSLLSAAASAANITYYLNLPVIDGYETWGTITTDGATTLAPSDVVDFNITFWSKATQSGYTLTPLNIQNFSWHEVTATPAGLVLGTDAIAFASVGSSQVCNPNGVLTVCYGYNLGINPPNYDGPPGVQYLVDGFGLTGSVQRDTVPVPFATRIPRAEPPRLFFVLSHAILGLETTPTLLQKVSAAQRYYEANDAANTCRQLTDLITDARAGTATGAVSDAVNRIVAAYANSIKMQIACAGCASQ
ncbi:MAG TPA: hypothetical protein VKT22_09060 [Steroidobacteraceae bacterium]|nr:hypothetical protein [Steroidobacteraceae bacterium]